ncbi:hypothetical protein B0T10DRAFT_568782 [Thelonectria olida]|uniref:Uncharacterized protein n=1 Tax=Thelonectria olida TaxID=1576542 RepID=A0A9P9AEH6_9HYPO|nr:hypothetical protein B0T10DRAFT_568782 [Thelonectria olida]
MCASFAGYAEFRLPEQTHPDCSNVQIVWEDSTQRRPKRRKRSQRSLSDSVPQSEEQWQSSREAFGLDTPENILDKATQLRNLDLNRNTGARLEIWQELVFIAVTVVDSSIGKDTTQILTNIYGHLPTYSTCRQDKAAILRIIGFIDELYSYLEHRAFELLIVLNISLPTLRSTTHEKFQELKTVQKVYEPKEEIQASAPFYIPFLVWLVRPEYTLDQICNALGTHTLGQHEFERFQTAFNGQKLPPCLLDTLGDYRTPRIATNADKQLTGGLTPDDGAPSTLPGSITSSDLSNVQTPPGLPEDGQLDDLPGGLDWSDIIDYEKYVATINISIAGYTTFDLSAELQHEVSRAGETKIGPITRIKKPGLSCVQYDWTEAIWKVVDKVCDYLEF